MKEHGGKVPGLSWDWHVDTWAWLPSAGSWTPDLGGPAKAVHIAATTADIPAAERFDFWRDLTWYDFDPKPLDRDSRRDFYGHGQAIFSQRGTIELFASGAAKGRTMAARSRREEPRLYIGFMEKGERRHASADGWTTITRPGSSWVLDTTRPTDIEWTDRGVLQLSVLRNQLKAELGLDELPSERAIAHALSASRLPEFLRAQLDLLARCSELLTDMERAAANDVAFDLFSAIVKAASADNPTISPPTSEPALCTAAIHYIEKNLSVHDLDAERIAHAVGCSRATLYRAFATRGTAVADALRQMRIGQARRLLKEERRLSISEVAMRCGLPEPRTFNRLFKQIQGMTPSEFRRSLTSSASAAD